MPLFWRSRSFSDKTRFSVGILAGEVIPGKPLADYLRARKGEAVEIIHLLAVVVTEGLLIQVAVKVERLNADIGAIQAALQEAPEVLKAVSVDLPINRLNCVVNNLMLVVSGKTVIRKQRVGVERLSGFEMFAYFRSKGLPLAVVYDLSANLAATFQDAHDSGLVFAASAGDAALTPSDVQVTSLAAD